MKLFLLVASVASVLVSVHVGCSSDVTALPDVNVVVDASVEEAATPDGDAPEVAPGGDGSLVVDSSVNSGLGPYAVRLAYFPGATPVAPAFADLCFKLAADATWTRVYAAPGLAQKEVGRYANFPSKGTYDLRVIDAASTCDSPFHQTSVQVGNDSVNNRVNFLYSNGITPSVSSSSFYRFTPADIPGKDRMRAYLLSTSGPVYSVEFSDGANQTKLGSFFDVTAGTVGNFVINYQDATPDVLFPYRAGNAVSTSIFVTGTGSTVLFCDDYAPPKGNLSDCSPTLRTP
ncbi:MAG: hypothetical protein KBF88_16655 [Polyangiaceae bacterium]|nr:hypothetical protein [Polyangiaceae bacterium]